jgi:hypothetical protein
MPNFLNLFWSTKEVPKNNPIPLYQTLAPLKEEFMSVPQRKYAITVSLLRGIKEVEKLNNDARQMNQSVIDMFEGVPVND